MRIEWLNDEMTEARVTRGWFRKRHAVVSVEVHGYLWKFKGSNLPVGAWLDGRLDAAVGRERSRRAKAMRIAQWQPLATMPAAKVVRR